MTPPNPSQAGTPSVTRCDAANSSYDQLLRGVVKANQQLLTAAHLHMAVPEVLAFLGEAAGADRAYVYKNHPHPKTGETAISLRFEWTREGIAGTIQQPHWQNLAYRESGLQRWLEAFSAGEPIHGLVSTFPPEEQAFLVQDQIRSLLMMPVYAEGQLWGCIGFDVCGCDRVWNEAEQVIVQAAADSLGGAIARQQTLEALRRSELRLQKFSANVPGMLYQLALAPDGGITFPYVSSACWDILELSPEALLDAQAALQQTHPDDLPRLQAAIRYSAKTLKRFQQEWRITPPSGQEKWVQGIAQPERQGDGSILWNGVLLDISDRRAIEAQQKEQAQFLQGIWEGVDQGIFVLEVLADAEEFRFVDMNPALIRTSPVPPEALLGKTLTEAFPPEMATLYRQRYQACARSKQRIRFEERLEGAGQETWWLVTLNPLCNEAGVTHQIVVTATEITDRKQSEIALLQIRKAIESASDAIGLMDTQMQMVYQNPAQTALFGYTLAAINAQGSLRAVIKDPAVFAEMTTAAQAGRSWRGEVVMRNAAGAAIDVDVRVDLIRDSEGTVLGFIGTHTDITEQKRAEEQVRRTNAILTAQQEAVPDGFLVVDENRRVVSYNQHFCELWGMPPEIPAGGGDQEILDRLLSQLHQPDEFLAQVDYLYTHPTESSREVIYLVDGRVFDRFSAPVRSPEGENLGRIWYFQDITEQKQAETRIQESYNLLNSVINGTRDLIFVKDVQGEYKLANARMTEVFCDRDCSLIGKDDSALYPAEVARNIKIFDQQILAQGRAHTFEQRVPVQGEIRTFLTSKTPYRDAEGTIIGLIGISRDITELKEAETRIQESYTLLNNVINGTTDFIFAKNREGEYILVNQAFLNAFNLQERDVIGQKDSAIFPEAVVADIQALDRQLLTQRQSKTYEETVPIGNEQRTFLTNKSPYEDAAGNVLGLIGIAHDITPLKQAEARFQGSFSLLSSVINGTTDIIFVKDLDGIYRLVNTAFSSRFGLTPEDIIGRDDAFLYPEETAAQLIDNEQQVLELGTSQTLEEKIPIQGEIRTYLTTKTPHRDVDGNLIGVICISRDITEIQQIQEERDRYFHLSSDMICIVGFDGYLKRINPAFTHILGYTELELLAVPFLDFIHPDDVEASSKVAAQVVGGMSLYSFENRWRCKDGSYRWLSWSSTPYEEAGIVYATARDITQRKATEAALEVSEQRFRDVTEAAGEYVWEIDAEGRYIFLTDKVKAVKGHSAEALLGQSPFAVMPTDDCAPVEAILQEASANKSSFTLQHRNITPLGTVVWEEVSGLPMLDEAGNILGFRGTGLSITEKKRAEAELRLFKQAVESSSDAICISDADVCHTYQNQAFSNLLEFESVSIFNEAVGSIINTYADPQIAQMILRTVQREGSYSGEVMLRSRGGRLIPALLRANAIKDEDDNIIGTIRSYTDISDRKQAEAQLQMQEQFLRSIYDGTTHRIFALSVQTDGNIVYTSHNRSAEEVTGWSSASINGRTPEELFGAEEGRAIRATCQRCIESGEVITQEEHITRNGVCSWSLTTFSPLRDMTGKIHRIIGTSFDITPIKEAEAQLKQQVKLAAFRAEIDSLLTRGESLRTMLQDCCQVIVHHMDAALARVWTHHEAEQMLELQASAGLYTHIDGGHARIPVGQFKIGYIAESRQPYLTNDIQHDPRVGNPEWARQEGMVAFAGYPLIVDDHLLGVMALFSRQELPARSLETLRLVADEIALGVRRKQTELQLQESETKLRQRASELKTTLQELQKAQARLVQGEKMSSLGQLVAGVAHEINNPVNFIYGNLTHARGYTENLLNLMALYQTHYPAPHPEIQEEAEAMDLPFVIQDLPKLLNSMKVGAERIQGIVTSLRIFSRMDEAEMKAVNIHDGIDSTLMILQNRLKAHPNAREITVVQRYGELPKVECYAGQLNQVFMNILSNAIDAMEKIRHPEHSHVAPEIQIHTALTPDDQVEIRISDNGCGIPAHLQSRLFDPFFTTKPIGQGTGMGLSISYQVVTERHGGSLTCESTVGEGTTFTITIPLSQT